MLYLGGWLLHGHHLPLRDVYLHPAYVVMRPRLAVEAAGVVPSFVSLGR